MRISAPIVRGAIPQGVGQKAVQNARIAGQRDVRNGANHKIIEQGMENTRAARARYRQIAERRFEVNASTVFDVIG